MERQMISRIGKIGMFVAGAALPLLVLGCESSSKSKPAPMAHKEPMAPKMEEPGRAIDRMSEMQAINGAHNDATLYPQDFDGGELNALGKSKLAMIIKGTPSGQATVVTLWSFRLQAAMPWSPAK